MNVGRGLFRLWLVMAAFWVCLVWLFMHDAKWAFPEAAPSTFEPWMLPAAIPPLVVFVFGAALFWAIGGFRS